MKIICLIRALPPTIFFVNRIHAHHRVSLVVVEGGVAAGRGTRLGRLRGHVERRGLARTLADLFGILRRKARCLDLGKGVDPEPFFDGPWRDLDPSIPRQDTADINDGEILRLLEAEKPDLILDHGTGLVADTLIATAGDAWNLHWGLSPYYRGVACTEWALINRDPYNIGVTIHRLSKRIDGGDILAQRRVPVAPGERTLGINYKLTRAGTDLVLDLLRRLEKGLKIEGSVQDSSAGLLRRAIHW